MDKRLHPLRPLPAAQLRALSLAYFGPEGEDYLADQRLALSYAECSDYATAAATLQQYYEQATATLLQTGKLAALGIPAAAEDLIYFSWERRRQHPQIWGRFDLAGILDGAPAGLIEYNADTASVLPETAIIAPAYGQRDGLNLPPPFEDLLGGLTRRFRQLAGANVSLERSLLIGTLGHPEDEANAHVLAMAALEADFDVIVAPLEEIIFSPEEGIFLENSDGYQRFPFFCKYFPWDFVAEEEPELLHLLTQVVTRQQAIVVNPAYCMLWQSKAMLAYLWEHFPGAPYLLPTFGTRPQNLAGVSWVQKPCFGRMGENIKIVDDQQRVLDETAGAFGHQPTVWQQYQALPVDGEGNVYQAQIFVAEAPAGLSFRRSSRPIVNDEDGEFVPAFVAG